MAEILGAFPSCPIPKITRLGRTLRRWRSAILAYFDTAGASNGPTEAVRASSKSCAASPAASATSTTTGYGPCSPLAAIAPGGRPPTHTQL